MKPAKSDHVYAVVDAPFVKIGRCYGHPGLRVRDLQCANPRELKLVWFVQEPGAFERFMHQQFANQRVRGEWFSIGRMLIENWNQDRLDGTPGAWPDLESLLDDRLHLWRVRQYGETPRPAEVSA